MTPRIFSLLVAALLALASGPATADPSSHFETRAQALSLKIAKRALKRARRALVLGPQVGAAPSYSFDGDSGFRGSFGLSLLYFDIPVIPSAESLAAILKHHAREQFVSELSALAAQGRGSTEEEKHALAEKVWKEIVDEFMLKYHAKRFEKPRFAARTSVRRLSSQGVSAWELGFTLGIGIGPVYLSGGEAVQVNHGAGLNTEFELALPMTLSRSMRSPTIEFFLGASIANTKRDERPDRAMIGARIMLDII